MKTSSRKISFQVLDTVTSVLGGGGVGKGVTGGAVYSN